jgi:hypothetical protein
VVVFKLSSQHLLVNIKKNQEGMPVSSWRKIILEFGCVNNWKILAHRIMKTYNSADILEKSGAPKQRMGV